jgi:hypothetical protein
MSNFAHDIKAVSSIFDSQKDLDYVLAELERRGLAGDVSVLMSEQTRGHYGDYFYDRSTSAEGFKHTSKLPEGAATGGLTGGILGAIIGGLTMAGSVLIPGAGLLVAGPLVGALTAGAIGTAAGSLMGALVGAGIPETEAKFYEESLKNQGTVLIVAHVHKDMVTEVKELFKRCGAQSVKVV